MKNKNKTNERLALLAFEFWCSLGDEEASRFKNEFTHNLSVISGMPTSSTGVKANKKYFSTYYTQLIEIVLLFIGSSEEDEDDSWNMSKASAYVLHILVQIIDSELMGKILNYIEAGLPSEDLKLKNISLQLFAACCDTFSHKNRMYEFIFQHLNKVVKFLFHESVQIKKSSSFLLSKITKSFSKSGLFDASVLKSVVPIMINGFNSSNKIAINIISALINLTKSLGDPDTLKSTNLISPYFEKIFSDLVVVAFREGAFDKDENLTMYCFLLIDVLIEYSSHDKQDKLSEILLYFLNQFEGTLSGKEISNMSTSGSSEVLLQLQSYYCTIFRAVFKKSVKKINLEVGAKIFELILMSFKSRQGVFEEAILAVGALAWNMGEPFAEIMPKFSDYLLYALNSFNDSSLCKSAIISLGHIVKSIKIKISLYTEKFIPVLLQILTHDDVSRSNKTIAITTLGDICMASGEEFLKYLEPVMTVFFSAATMATSVADSDDEDTEEFLKDLRYELIEAFTCISFGLEDCGKRELFARFVPHIFSFFNTILGDNYTQRQVIFL